MTPYRIWQARRCGYTLVEMLIVVSIMIVLVAVTLPVAKKVMDGSQGREASRQLNAYFAMAKARALQTGRPCGVYFPFQVPLGHTDPSLTAAQIPQYWPVRAVTQIYLAETPQHYSGSTTNARGRVTGGNFVTCDLSGNNDSNEAGYLGSLLNNKEQFLVRFNFKGDWYICTNAGNNVFTYVRPLQGVVQPPSTASTFQILRSPRPIGNALDLPQGTCIDITYSGVGNSARQFPLPPTLNSIAAGVYVMFSPNGSVDAMYINSLPTDPPVGSLYFLIGKIEKVGGNDPWDITNSNFKSSIYPNKDISNLADPTSLWVVVSRSTGQVMTAENMPDPTKVNGTDIRPYLLACRQAAIYGEQMTGR